MPEILSELASNASAPISSGLSFVWAISLGQVLTFLIFFATLFGGIVRLSNIFIKMRSNQEYIMKQLDSLSTRIESNHEDNKDNIRANRDGIQHLNQNLHATLNTLVKMQKERGR